MYVYEHMDFVISMMLHSSIYSFGAKCPVVNIGYDKKNTAFMEMIKHPNRSIDVRKVNTKLLTKTCQEALSKGFSDEDKNVLKSLRNSTDSFVKQIHELLNS